MNNISLENNQLKQTIKEIIIEVIRENKEELSDLIIDLMEENSLLKAIKEGENTELVEKESLMAILKQKS
ncbi:MAG: hypothetical protein IGQ45_10075 [Cyanobacterium sp. T60_A2020_053]|nr:hypothetical protein [Cyanobacterium sp. T60_A2020_053]